VGVSRIPIQAQEFAVTDN